MQVFCLLCKNKGGAAGSFYWPLPAVHVGCLPPDTHPQLHHNSPASFTRCLSLKATRGTPTLLDNSSNSPAHQHTHMQAGTWVGRQAGRQTVRPTSPDFLWPAVCTVTHLVQPECSMAHSMCKPQRNMQGRQAASKRPFFLLHHRTDHQSVTLAPTCGKDAITQPLSDRVQVVHDALIASAAQPQQLVVLGTVHTHTHTHRTRASSKKSG